MYSTCTSIRMSNCLGLVTVIVNFEYWQFNTYACGDTRVISILLLVAIFDYKQFKVFNFRGTSCLFV